MIGVDIMIDDPIVISIKRKQDILIKLAEINDRYEKAKRDYDDALAVLKRVTDEAEKKIKILQSEWREKNG